MKKTLIFAAAAYNLAETSRMIEIAREAQKYFNILFADYGGPFESLIEKEGFEIRRLTPRITEKKLKQLKKCLNGDVFNTVGYFNARELAPRVEEEIALFKEIKPAAVITGWCLSVTLSARAAGIPFINVLHSTSITEYYKEGRQPWPDKLHIFKKWFPEKKLIARGNRRVFEIKFVVTPYNKVGKKYGLKEFSNFIELIEGDYVLLADIPSWVNLKSLRPHVRHIGPLPARLNLPLPEEIKNIKKDLPIVFFAMGSSGKPGLIKSIIESFRGKPYRIIAPVKKLVEELKIDVPPNVIVTGFIPSHKVNPLASAAVIHGGQNTVMNACLSATPFVGIGMHVEQEANIEACVVKGFAIRLNKHTLKPVDIILALEKILKDKEAKKKIENFSRELKEWNGPVRGADFLRETFGP